MRYFFNNPFRHPKEYNKEADTIVVDANIPSNVVSSGDGYPVPKTMRIIAATRLWWELMKDGKLFISQLAWEQISAGDEEDASKRQELAMGMGRLIDKEGVDDIVEALKKNKIFSEGNLADARILANACVHEMDYLVTTNMDDLVKKNNKEAMVQVIEKAGYSPPIIITPADFLIDVLGVTNFATSDRQFNDA